eukprot:30953-Chlamydomonas_euryale.AAC.8
MTACCHSTRPRSRGWCGRSARAPGARAPRPRSAPWRPTCQPPGSCRRPPSPSCKRSAPRRPAPRAACTAATPCRSFRSRGTPSHAAPPPPDKVGRPCGRHTHIASRCGLTGFLSIPQDTGILLVGPLPVSLTLARSLRAMERPLLGLCFLRRKIRGTWRSALQLHSAAVSLSRLSPRPGASTAGPAALLRSLTTRIQPNDLTTFWLLQSRTLR